MKDEDIASLDTIVEEPNLPEAQINVEPPADKDPQVRDETGKFASDKPKEETKVEAPKEQPKPEVKAEPRTIPLAAHLEERKALKSEMDQLRAEIAALKNPPKAPAPIPEFQDDPKAYVDHKAQSVVERLEATSKQVEEAQKTAQMSAQQAERVQFQNYLQQTEAQFVAQTPDYYDALGHIRQIRAKQLQVFDPNITQEQIRDVIIREEMGLAEQIARQGRNPSQTAYEIAKAYGYTPKAAQQAAAAIAELPKVAGPKQLPPDQTLGTGSAPVDDTTGEPDAFEQAFGEMFGKKKRA
jgi:hypothetical protein